MPDYTMKNLYSQGQYEDAIEYASDAEVRGGFTEWDYLFLSKCLYKLKRYAEYLEYLYHVFLGGLKWKRIIFTLGQKPF